MTPLGAMLQDGAGLGRVGVQWRLAAWSAVLANFSPETAEWDCQAALVLAQVWLAAVGCRLPGELRSSWVRAKRLPLEAGASIANS